MKNFRILGMIPAVLLAVIANNAIAGPFFNGFETDDACWTDVTRVASGGGALGVTSATGEWHAETLLDGPEGYVFTRWGGYGDGDDCDSTSDNLVFPAGGYFTAVDVYFDVDAGLANDSRMDFSSAINNTDGDHRRDFIIHCGFYNDDRTDVGLGSGNRYICSVSNNAPGWPANPDRAPVVLTTESGWFTLVHHFYDDGTGVLAVDMIIADADRNVLGTWTLSTPDDEIGVTVGGNRYGWFVTQGMGSMAIDNSRRSGVNPLQAAAAEPYVPVPTTGKLSLAILVIALMIGGVVGLRRIV